MHLVESNFSKRLTRNEAAAHLGVNPQTLANWAHTGKVKIPFHKVGRSFTSSLIWMLIWIPPAERRRFKGLDMAYKTKAAMQGRQRNQTKINQRQITRLTAGGQNQPFGSMPCRRNSSRASSFNQLPRLTPSRSAASLSCCRNSGVILIWKVGERPSPFGVLSRLIVDMYVRNLIAWILLCTYVITTNMQKTTPRTAGTVPGRLTSTDS